MNIKQRMNPELWKSYEHLPAVPTLVDDLVTKRAQLAEQVKAFSADLPRSKRVSTRDVNISGPPGAPSVRCRLYTPSVTVTNAPALLWIHGGGFTVGNLDQDDILAAKLVDDAACVVVSVEYRLAPEFPFPAGVEDCYAALCWLTVSAGELGVDLSRIAVGGESAGGGLAAGVALMARDRGKVALAYQLLLCPCLDDRHITQSSYEITDPQTWNRTRSLQGWRAYLGGELGQKDVSPYAAPARAGDLGGLPPAYLMVGELDLMRDDTLDYASRLMRAGVSTELHIWPGAFHGFEVMVPHATISKQAVGDYIAALKRALGTT